MDWHLALAVLAMLSVILIMVMLSVAVPVLRPDLVLKPDIERPRGRTVSLYKLYNKNRPAY